MAYYNEKAEVMRMKKGKEDDRDKTDYGFHMLTNMN